VSNPNPWQARLALALKDKPGDLAQAQQRTWAVLCLTYERLGLVEDAEEQRKWVLAYVQIASAYAKLYEASELEARLAALEAAVKQGGTR
jgi:hypothetical protein